MFARSEATVAATRVCGGCRYRRRWVCYLATPHSWGQDTIRRQLLAALYYSLNPLVGGPSGNGWPFGGTVHASSIASVFQNVEGISYLGDIQLFQLRRRRGSWERTLAHKRSITLSPIELACSGGMWPWGPVIRLRLFRTHDPNTSKTCPGP